MNFWQNYGKNVDQNEKRLSLAELNLFSTYRDYDIFYWCARQDSNLRPTDS